MVRLYRLLAEKDFIEEVAEEQYKPTEFSLHLGDKESPKEYSFNVGKLSLRP